VCESRDPGREEDGGREAALVLELVRGVVADVHPHQSPAAVTLDSRLERELGLGSLELVELLVRVEDALDVALSSKLLATAESPRDLVREVRAARGRSAGRPRAAAVGTQLRQDRVAGVASPRPASTLIEALRRHVEATPDRTHIRILDEPGVEEEVSYGALNREATGLAAGLLARGLGFGDMVAIMLPTGRSYFSTFVGVLLAGGVPVPIYPPARSSQLADHLRRHSRILDNAQATLLVTVPEAVPLGRLLLPHVASLRGVVVPEELATAPGGGALPVVAGEDVALLQYTSGSTGHPKGVVLTHADLLANIRAMGQVIAASSTDLFVSWLPLYHDMGLIGAWLSSLYFGVPLVVMPPQVFLMRPSRWLWAIHDQHATISAGPNFGYELCLRRIDDAELEGLDLSALRLSFNGAEPVSPATIERFAARFARYGLRPEVITPVYGLAEASVGLTFPPLGRGPLVDRIVRETFLRSGRAVRADENDTSAPRFVACGRPLPGYELRVVDATGGELGDRQEGRIEFRGPSATSGYYRNPAATRSLFHGHWLDTGDLGYVAGGELYVTGRVKDIIIRAGRNLHPDELEEAVGNLPGVRKGCVAAFASPDPDTGTERLVVLTETRKISEAARGELRSQIVGIATDLLGTAPDDVILAPPHTVPKTFSGKIRRAASREVYQRGAIGKPPAPVWWQLARFGWSGARHGLRRVLRTVAAAAFAGYAWLLLVMMAVPLLVLLAFLPGEQWRWRSVRAAIRLLGRLTVTPIAVQGLERVPSGPWVAVANHTSWLDGLVLAAVLPESCRFVAGEIFARRPLIGFVLRCVGTQFVERTDRERGVSDTEQLLRSARLGQCLVWFPEGSVFHAPGLRTFHMGAFVVAAQADVPIVPLAIQGTRAILRPGNFFPRRGAIHVVANSPIYPAGTDWAAAAQLQRSARTSILTRCGEPDLE
jgi:1-acyl-sn-glycerol-3-phosphate acyltransferase